MSAKDLTRECSRKSEIGRQMSVEDSPQTTRPLTALGFTGGGSPQTSRLRPAVAGLRRGKPDVSSTMTVHVCGSS
jgi:hypothetical protein